MWFSQVELLSIFGQELSAQSVLFDLQEYVVSLKAISTSPFLPFSPPCKLPLSSFTPVERLYLGGFLWIWMAVRVMIQEEMKRKVGLEKGRRWRKRGRGCDSLLPADWGNKGVHCTVHCTRWERTSCYSCRAQVQIKSVCGSAYVCVRRLLTQNEERPLHGNWLTRCSSCRIQIAGF